MPAGSTLDPFKNGICEQLRADPTIQSLRLREMAADLGYEGGKTIFDDCVREIRRRFLIKRTFRCSSTAGAIASMAGCTAASARSRSSG
jgi:hypothetical protein